MRLLRLLTKPSLLVQYSTVWVDLDWRYGSDEGSTCKTDSLANRMMVNGYKGLNDFRHSAVFTILKILIKSGDMEGQVGTMVFEVNIQHYGVLCVMNNTALSHPE